MQLELQTRHIFVDASIFVSANFDYSSKKFESLIALAQQDSIFIKLTDITVQEIEANTKKSLEQAKNALQSFRNKAYILRNLSFGPFREIFGKVDFAEYEIHLTQQLQNFLQEAKVEIISTEDVSTKVVFEKYFKRKPPFGSGKKKSEFPDAFVIETLLNWCQTNNEQIYIISTDDDMKQACQEYASILYLESLEDFTDRVIRADGELSSFLKLLDLYQETIKRNISSEFEKTGQLLESEDQRIMSIEVEQVNLLKRSLVTLEAEFAVVNYETEIIFEVEIEYVELDEVYFDDEGNPFVVMKGVGRIISRKLAGVPVEITFQFSEYNPTLLNAENLMINDGKVMLLDDLEDL